MYLRNRFSSCTSLGTAGVSDVNKCLFGSQKPLLGPSGVQLFQIKGSFPCSFLPGLGKIRSRFLATNCAGWTHTVSLRLKTGGATRTRENVQEV